MKTAVSISDEVYEQAELTASQLGMSRSRFYTLAVKEYVQTHKPDAITSKLNEIYGGTDSSLDDDILQTNYDLISKVEW